LQCSASNENSGWVWVSGWSLTFFTCLWYFQPGFSRTRNPFFWLFSTTRNPGFFNYQTRVFEKSWNCCCIQILTILIALKLQIGACNGRTSTFELSAIIMRQEVRVLLSDHRTFVVGPLIFSFNWPIQTDRDVILPIIGVYANFCLFANLIK